MATTKKAVVKKVAKKAPVAKTEGAVAKKAERVNLAEVQVYTMAGAKASTIALPESIFATPWKADLVHQVSTAIAANLRQNRAHTKDRSEVAGGGKKPWKQKGTGQARHGSTRSPIWRHGGVTFGPRSERDYSEKINRKAKIAALYSVLARKARDGEIILVDSLSFAAPKTAAAKTALVALAKATDSTLATKRRNSALIALASYDAGAVKSFRNIGSVKTEEVRNLNTLDLLTYKYLVIEKPADAFKVLADRSKK